MASIRSALALALVTFAVAQYPLQEQHPDLNALYGQLGESAPGSNPTVKLTQGIVHGKRTCLPDSSTALECFLGIPYAVPPIGTFRFGPPRTVPNDPTEIVNAQEYGPSCIQATSRAGNYRVQGHVSEDCLTLNIIRPASTKSYAKLPVMVWIHGGGFTEGGSVLYDGSELVLQSLAINRPVIFVSMNYRLNLFGFIASTDVQKRAKRKGDVRLNLGLVDQRLALQWVKKNIDAFGGDSSKVTLFGESAGAISIGGLLLATRGRHSGLFRGAILESGAATGYPVPPPEEYDDSYARLAERVGCNSSAVVFECLRTVPLETYQDILEEQSSVAALALKKYPIHVVQDDDFYHTRPSEALKAGQIARIPTIIGTVLDEGSSFGPRDLASEKELREYLTENWVFNKPELSSETLDKLLEHYPDIPDLGSPYPTPARSPGSWDDNDRIFEPRESNQFKRVSSIFGDFVFESGRRAQLDDIVRAKVPVWNFRFMQPPNDRPELFGTYHGSEIPHVFAKLARTEGAEGEVSRLMSRAWINFAHDLNPNGPDLPTWPVYSLEKRETLQIMQGNTTIIEDDYRKEAIEWIGHDDAWMSVTGR